MKPTLKFMLLLYGLTLLGWGVSLAAEPTTPQLKRTAQVVLHLSHFVRWPFRICLVGKEPHLDSFTKAMQGKRVHQREVEVVQPANPSEFLACDVIYTSNRSLEQLSSATRKSPILTISAEPNCDTLVCLTKENKPILHHDHLKATPLKISSELRPFVQERFGE